MPASLKPHEESSRQPATDKGREAPTSDSTPQAQAEIRRLLSAAAAAEKAAFFNLEPKLLQRVYTGAALSAYSAQLRQLVSEGLYERHDLKQQHIEAITVYEDGRARAQFREIWTLTVYNQRTRRCVSHYPEYSVAQSARLKHEPDGWKIYSLNTQSPAPRAGVCPDP
jgi:hypothetical protein